MLFRIRRNKINDIGSDEDQIKYDFHSFPAMYVTMLQSAFAFQIIENAVLDVPSSVDDYKQGFLVDVHCTCHDHDLGVFVIKMFHSKFHEAQRLTHLVHHKGRFKDVYSF
jgi:hypothetical protein